MGATAVINHKEPLTPQLEKLGVKQLDYVLLAFDPDLFMDELAGLIAPMGHINAILPIMKLSPAASGGLFWKAANISYTLMYTKAMFNVGRAIDTGAFVECCSLYICIDPQVESAMQSQGDILAACAKAVDAGHLVSTATEEMDFTLENLRKAMDKIASLGGGFLRTQSVIGTPLMFLVSAVIGKIVLKMPEGAIQEK